MAYCRECGALLQEGTVFCPKCGAPVENAPAPQADYPAHNRKKTKKPIVRRWWFWVLVLILIAGAAGRVSRGNADRTAIATAAPAVTAAPTATAALTEEPAAAVKETGVRPEVKEFLDAYEACMDEYVEFMRKYMSADPTSMVSMMGDYYAILGRYTEFAEKIDAMDESELSDAELAYYIEVTSRVNQKLLGVTG